MRDLPDGDRGFYDRADNVAESLVGHVDENGGALLRPNN